MSGTPFTSYLTLRLLACCVCLLPVSESRAIVFYSTGDAGHNTSAPTGIYANSGWQYQGYFGSFLGTMISPRHFITAQHIGNQGSTFIHKAEMSGESTDITYTVDTAVNGGLGYWDIAGTDFRVYQVNETFTSYAELYTGTLETGSTIVTMGRGGPRGDEVIMSGESKGWKAGVYDGIARWGANVVTGVLPSGSSDLLVAEFNRIGLDQEAFLTAGDSGGGVFILDGGTWKLAGLNYAADGPFDTNDDPNDSSDFYGAIYDRGGLYQPDGLGGWNQNPNTPFDQPANFYASRISSSAGAILSVVPEPGSAVLVMLGAVVAIRRRRV
jgi:hypothetical protein